MTSAATTLRVGLVGTGAWASDTHAAALCAHPGTDLVGVWGRRPEAAAEIAGRHGTRVYEDVDELFAACDAVAFAVPPDVQAPLAARAAAAGCHLLLDKPLATSVEAAREVVEATRKAGVASVVFFTLRFAGATSHWLDRQAAEGGWFTARADWYGALYSPGDASEQVTSPWRVGRGALWDVGPHALSVLLPVLGDVTSVTAARGPADTVHLVLSHASGASATATLSLTTPARAAGIFVELRGTSGVVSIPSGGASVDAYGGAIGALLESVRSGRPHACDAGFALRVTEILTSAETCLG
ncbi:Gfo/Idh/MocA family oxidoreductase [Streptomyces antnestii]|uniref:Gfo/Idh/MocA family oxidoreductase n=1 Tax=Streptomyces antnestii TaxID=2494256 RepID=A0A437PZP6_9ACTN|nr:Gfo/Idh/MocA family oxidoreductase [Streptomyces sp. San01]RVU27720.1 Gfo/Idh/MocA family oxidoreductase [Streptomyces sp. San01]